MITKDDLDIMRDYPGQIAELNELLTRLRSALEGRSSASFFGRGSRSETDKLGANIARIDKLERTVAFKQRRLNRARAKLSREMQSMSERRRKVFGLRYLDGLPWDIVAKEAGLDIRWCYRLVSGYMNPLDTPVETV